MARWLIERCDPDYRDEQTGRVPWAVVNLDDRDHGQETFATRSQAVAYKKEMEGKK